MKLHSVPRIQSLDLIRGIALLGILLINIRVFSSNVVTYYFPYALGDLSVADQLTYMLTEAFAHSKFIGIFSMLFGVGLIIFRQNLENKNLISRDYTLRRLSFLLLFGLLHGFLVWFGDILVLYSLCGLLVMSVWRWNANKLFLLSSLFFTISLISGFFFVWTKFTDPTMANPYLDFIDAERQSFLGNWFEQLGMRREQLLAYYSNFPKTYIWSTMALMLMGMGLYKVGFFSSERTTKFYQKIAFITLGTCLPIALFNAYVSDNLLWEPHPLYPYLHLLHFLIVPPMVIGYSALFILWQRSRSLYWLQYAITCLGRMAFSGYILTSLLCTFIFYGHGLGLYGQYSYFQQLYFVVSIWIILLLLAPLWLHFFKQGPLEALWRKLTYGSKNRLAKKNPPILQQ